MGKAKPKAKQMAVKVGGPSKSRTNPIKGPRTSKRRSVRAPTNRAPTTLLTRMSPIPIMQFINSGLSERQVSDIRDMGFGGILCLKTGKLPGDLALWLVSDFDPFTSSFESIQLPIRDEDVHLAVGLPVGDLPIEEASKYDQADEFLSIVAAWKAQYEGVDKVTNTHILQKMAQQKEGGQQFKRNFIVFIVSAFLMGVKGEVPSQRILKCLGDVSLIPRLKWCEYTRKNIISSVEQWRKEKVKEEEGGSRKTFKGPIMVLILIYLDRMVFKVRTVDRVFPTLCTWTKKAISARVSQEKREARRFGAGFVEGPLVKHPGCVGVGFVESNITDVGVDQDTSGVDALGVPNNIGNDVSHSKRSRVSICLDKLANAGKVLAEAFEIFSEVVNEAKVLMPNSSVVGQLSEMTDSLMGGFQLTQLSSQEVSDKGGTDNARPSSQEVSDKDATDNGCNKLCNQVIADGQGADACDAAHVAHVAATTGVVQGPRVIATTGGPDDDPCSNDEIFLRTICALSCAFRKDPEPAGVPAAKKRRVAPEYPSFNLFSDSQDKSESDGSQHQSPAIVPSTPSVPDNHFPESPHPPVQSMAVPHNKRDIQISDVYKSPFVQRNKIKVYKKLNDDEDQDNAEEEPSQPEPSSEAFEPLVSSPDTLLLIPDTVLNPPTALKVGKPCFGWFGPKDEDDYVLLKPAPV